MTLPTNWKHKSVKDRKGFRLSPTTQSPCFETWCIFIYSIYQRPALAYQPFHLGEDVQRELLPIIWTTIHVETSSRLKICCPFSFFLSAIFESGWTTIHLETSSRLKICCPFSFFCLQYSNPGSLHLKGRADVRAKYQHFASLHSAARERCGARAMNRDHDARPCCRTR